MIRLNEMATLRYKDNNELVSLGDDHQIKISINPGEHEQPHFNIVNGTQVCRISINDLCCMDGDYDYEKVCTKKQFNAIVDWAAQNKDLLQYIYSNSYEENIFSQDFTILKENVAIQPTPKKKYKYDRDIPIKEATLVDNKYLKVDFKCGLSKLIDLENLWNKPPYRELQDYDVRSNFITNEHCLIFNDNTDISSLELWTCGKLIDNEELIECIVKDSLNEDVSIIGATAYQDEVLGGEVYHFDNQQAMHNFIDNFDFE